MKDMLGRGRAASVEEVLGLLEKSFSGHVPPETSVPLEEARARVLSADVRAPEDLPGFARSTMDGYAVISSDTFGAGEGAPAYLNATHEILMADEPKFVLRKGEAARIATGGMLPPGADAVVMLEHVQAVDGKMIEAQKAVAPGENVVQRGEDVREGELLLKRGRRLRPQDVAVLAGVGIAEIPVYERPKVSIISTGDEIVPPQVHLRAGLVRDTNSYHLAGLVSEEGALPVREGIFRDDYSVIRDVVHRAARNSQVVLISGGSSVGARDMTERVLGDLGRIIFHSVTMKPGKPLMAGIIGETPAFGLPGHPRAVAVCFEVFVRPVLRWISGLKPEAAEEMRAVVKARLSRNVRTSQGRQEHIEVALRFEGGQLWADPLLGKSGLITTMVRADGTVTVSQGRTGLEKDETVTVRLH